MAYPSFPAQGQLVIQFPTTSFRTKCPGKYEVFPLLFQVLFIFMNHSILKFSMQSHDPDYYHYHSPCRLTLPRFMEQNRPCLHPILILTSGRIDACVSYNSAQYIPPSSPPSLARPLGDRFIARMSYFNTWVAINPRRVVKDAPAGSHIPCPTVKCLLLSSLYHSIHNLIYP